MKGAISVKRFLRVPDKCVCGGKLEIYYVQPMHVRCPKCGRKSEDFTELSDIVWITEKMLAQSQPQEANNV